MEFILITFGVLGVFSAVYYAALEQDLHDMQNPCPCDEKFCSIIEDHEGVRFDCKLYPHGHEHRD